MLVRIFLKREASSLSGRKVSHVGFIVCSAMAVLKARELCGTFLLLTVEQIFVCYFLFTALEKDFLSTGTGVELESLSWIDRNCTPKVLS